MLAVNASNGMRGLEGRGTVVGMGVPLEQRRGKVCAYEKRPRRILHIGAQVAGYARHAQEIQENVLSYTIRYFAAAVECVLRSPRILRETVVCPTIAWESSLFRLLHPVDPLL
jgi:hypothetical protein